ncbi:MAG: 3-ketoacyl-ACP reductase [marine bacterium B5-7]|nr:MAG: 3-ketoacyl-ACP reductase [marine bacterium B5-7]
MDTFTDKWVLVTGSSRGIGRAVALRAARDGFNVVVHCRQQRTLAESTADAARAMGVSARVLVFDVCDRDLARHALETDIEEHEAYYGVVCNAGITHDAAFPAMTDSEWDNVIDVGLNGFYNVLKPVVMPMVRRRSAGRIITIASVSGLIGNRGQVNYSAAKGGVIAATKALAVELAKRQITVNCVAPGIIETDMVKPELMAEILKHVPIRRAGTVDEVAGAVSYLLGEDAGYVTRQVISVNGGLA